MLIGVPEVGKELTLFGVHDSSIITTKITKITSDLLSAVPIRGPSFNYQWYLKDLKTDNSWLYFCDTPDYTMKYLIPLGKPLEDDSILGGKGKNLNKLILDGVKVPPGFVIPLSVLGVVIKYNTTLAQRIRMIKESIRLNESIESINGYASNVRAAILSSPPPVELLLDIKLAWDSLGRCPVAIRSSASLEDSKEFSFAGQQDTILNNKDFPSIIKSIKSCWASLYNPRAVAYRINNKISEDSVNIAVVMQKMVKSTASGILFTKNPITNDQNEVIIEAALGLGEPIVSGQITPDKYVFNKESKTFTSKKISYQSWMLTSDNMREDINFSTQKITDDLLTKLINTSLIIESQNNAPQDIEWGIEDGELFILQARPITTDFKMASASLVHNSEELAKLLKPLSTGEPASPGIVSGRVRLVNSDNYPSVRPNDIIVCCMTSVEIVPVIKKIAGIITSQGGTLCHAAIISRENGIPCIVNSTATLLEDGMSITIDGYTGIIYEGMIRVEKSKDKKELPLKIVTSVLDVNAAEIIANNNNNGGIFISPHVLDGLNILHPNLLHTLSNNSTNPIVEKVIEYLKAFTSTMGTSPVFYLMNDYSWEENRTTLLANHNDTKETNPIIGIRGGIAHSLIEKELKAGTRKISNKKVTNITEAYIVEEILSSGVNNFYPIAQYLRTPSELSYLQNKFPSIMPKLWLMLGLPNQLATIDSFLNEDINGVIIDLPRLHQLIIGYDQKSTLLLEAYVSVRSILLENMVKEAIEKCRENGVTSLLLIGNTNITSVRSILKANPDGVIIQNNMNKQMEQLILSGVEK